MPATSGRLRGVGATRGWPSVCAAAQDPDATATSTTQASATVARVLPNSVVQGHCTSMGRSGRSVNLGQVQTRGSGTTRRSRPPTTLAWVPPPLYSWNKEQACQEEPPADYGAVRLEYLAAEHAHSVSKGKRERKASSKGKATGANSPMGRLLAQRNSTPPRDSTRGRTESASHRSGTPPRSARTGTTAVVSTDGVAPVDPPPLNPTRHRGAGAGTPPRSRAVVVDDAVARVLARREAAAAVAGARGRMNTPPRNRS